jgi:hypothetical protein
MRPDSSFAVSKLSRFISNPGDEHWNALDNVMCYLKGNEAMVFTIPGIRGYWRVIVTQTGYLMLMK